MQQETAKTQRERITKAEREAALSDVDFGAITDEQVFRRSAVSRYADQAKWSYENQRWVQATAFSEKQEKLIRAELRKAATQLNIGVRFAGGKSTDEDGNQVWIVQAKFRPKSARKGRPRKQAA